MPRPLLVAGAGALLALCRAEQLPPYSVHGPRPSRSLLHYFRRWAEPVVKQATEGASASGGGAPLSEAAILDAWRQHSERSCPSTRSTPAVFGLEAAELDAQGVQHALLRSATGEPQYLALAGGRVLASDPAGCPGAPRQRGLAGLGALAQEDLVRLVDEEDSRPLQLLDAKHDELVQDCMSLLALSAREACNRTSWSLDALSSTLEVLDGFLVRVYAKIHGAAGAASYGRVACAFGGAGATLLLRGDICAAGASDGVPPRTKEALVALEAHGTGELSRVKGYGHVYDELARWHLRAGWEPLPAEHSLVESFPSCFPGGQEAVREQGRCASCWAFAAASALSASACAAGDGRRAEVSVQEILTCNAFGLGCDGGHAMAAQSSFEAGIAVEGERPYVCSDAAGEACAPRPWGARPTMCGGRDPGAWRFGSAYAVAGEPSMMAALVQGRALYTIFEVYSNFMSIGDGIYDEAAGGLLGAHAAVCLGYGADGGGKKYWLLQNSWGPRWGARGFVRFLRGADLAGIERLAVVFEGRPEGAIINLARGGGGGGGRSSRSSGPSGYDEGSEVAGAAMLFVVFCVYIRRCCGYKDVQNGCCGVGDASEDEDEDVRPVGPQVRNFAIGPPPRNFAAPYEEVAGADGSIWSCCSTSTPQPPSANYPMRGTSAPPPPGANYPMAPFPPGANYPMR